MNALVYSSDDMPGIRRVRSGRGFAYVTHDGRRCSRATVEQCKALGIPPAWENVWICPDPNGHIQATGFDARGRKQYRYHPDWRAARDAEKFALLPHFGEVLPRLRNRVARDLEHDPGTKIFALAAIVSLLDYEPLRIGSQEYSRDNGTFGATTLQKRHMRLENGAVRLSFMAKGGKRVRRQINSRSLNRVFEKIAELPGRPLFSYIGEDGHAHPLRSCDVNAYLSDAADCEVVTAKLFRTWAGSLSAFEAAREARRADEKITLKKLAEAASRRLANTPTIARNSYIHPKVASLAGAAEARDLDRIFAAPPLHTRLRANEDRMLQFLQE